MLYKLDKNELLNRKTSQLLTSYNNYYVNKDNKMLGAKPFFSIYTLCLM